MGTCLICGSGFGPFLSFGKMPIANGFLAPEQFGKEYFFELSVGFCARAAWCSSANPSTARGCSTTSTRSSPRPPTAWREHFRRFADDVIRDLRRRKTRSSSRSAATTASLLQHFASAGIRHLGVEPSANVAEVAHREGRQDDVPSSSTRRSRERIVAEHGQADAFLGANVMCHIPYLHSVVAEGIRILLEAARRAHVRGPVPRRHRREDLLRPDLRRARVLLLGRLRRPPVRPARHGGHRRPAAGRARRLDALRASRTRARGRCRPRVGAQRPGRRRSGWAARRPTTRFRERIERSRDG